MKKIEFQILKFFPYFSLFLFLFFSNQMITGQRNIKYKDVFKVIEEKSKEEAYSLLLVYQKQDPFAPNTYLQLGLLSQYWSKEYDALTNLNDVEFFIYNTNLYYGLAISKIDQKEVRKNEKYYLNIDRFKGREKVEFEEVRSFLQEQIDANNEYSRNVQIVTKLFNSGIKHYNNCVKIFKEINTDNNKIKDIYLTANAKFMVKLRELESSFDSTIYYLQNYQTAIKNYPIKNYNQKYKLLPIETYRLQGLTGSDFLKEEIPIWNYGAWVKSLKQVLSSDIEDMRNSINKADQELNENISKLADTKEYKTNHVRYKVDDKLKYKIGKYDYQSVLLELFKFKESKVDFLASLKDPINNIKDTTNYTLLQKARYYETIIKEKEYCDSLNGNFSKVLNPYDINKYNDFFTNNYGGESGLKNYLKNENTFFRSQLVNSFNNLKEFLIQYNSKKENKNDTIHYKLAPIQLNKVSIDFSNVRPDTCYTIDYKQSSTGDYYITGYIKEGTNPCYPFIAKSNKHIDIKWLKVIPSAQMLNSTGIYIQAKEDGCDVLVHTPLDTVGQNQIYSFDNDGKQKDKFDLGIPAFPRYFNYDEINQKYLIIFKGYRQEQSECLDNDMIIIQFDGLAKKEAWRQKLKLNGTFVEIFSMDQNISLITNFTGYQSATNVLTSGAGDLPRQTNALIITIDQAGNIIREIPILNEKPFCITNAAKISSSTVNLLGFRNELMNFSAAQKNEFGELVYLLINSEGMVYFDNSKIQ